MRKKTATVWLMAGVTILSLSACNPQGKQDSSTHEQQDNQQEQQSSQDANKNKQTESQDQNDQSSESNEGQTVDKADQHQSNDNGMVTVAHPNDLQVLVNKSHKLPDGFVPKNLQYADVRFPYDEKVQKRKVRKVTSDALKQLFQAADNKGIQLFAQSGYRSYERQETVFASNVDRYGEKKASQVSAHPGTSEHQSGLAMDITSRAVDFKLIQAFGDTEAGRWVAKHAHEFGFIVRYPKGKQDITGYEYEPWHLRYVGKDAATKIYKKDWALEEYKRNE
ncbi:M15 family metallopeptidase [Tuberibacillus sp. Marseille-P3662]|uniref:M15 family metallopeptidase n=1 Tax=Tuberibacillus sp. Marseille-P3662 TaxID=1965358 RepID=UPI0015930AAE|nr:M15 family metallopeptidase [Tuberibacillus sp. Marseille-P3662]